MKTQEAAPTGASDSSILDSRTALRRAAHALLTAQTHIARVELILKRG